MTVFVLGMHRAGTSAITRVVNLLGVPLGSLTDLSPPAPDNRKGFWESATLKDLNDELLFFLGGTWDGPPMLSEGWVWDTRLDPHREVARRRFHEIYTTADWVWKDPRNCLLLPFWRDALNVRPLIVFAHRNPLEIADSLHSRNGFHKLLALALWERYVRSAVHEIRGLPVFVARYHDLLSEPRQVSESIRSFLEAHSVRSPERYCPEEIEEFVDAKLSSVSLDAAMVESDPLVTASQRRLFVALERLCGAHEAFEPPDLPRESEVTEPLLAERRRAGLSEARRRQDVDALQSECSRLQALLVQAQAELRQLDEKIRRTEDELHEKIRRTEEELQWTRDSLATADEVTQALSAELIASGEKLHAQRELIQRLHMEIANRESMIRSIKATGTWRLRNRLRQLALRGAD